MKKLVVLLFLLMLCGCGSDDVNVNVDAKDFDNDNVNIKNDEVNEEIKDKYVDDNPIKLSLYVDKKKISEFESSMVKFTDIVSLECYYTEDDSIIDGKFSDVFNNYYAKYNNIDNYKIGYRVKFSTSDGEVDRYIYRPSDVESYFNYIQTYLYDDIHQTTSWYSHVEDSKYNDSTRFTSIKFTASTYIDKVTSDVEVTVFTYLDKDIVDGKYIGNSKYTVVIKRI